MRATCLIFFVLVFGADEQTVVEPTPYVGLIVQDADTAVDLYKERGITPLRKNAAVVRHVIPGGSGERAGIVPLDMIYVAEGKRIESAEAFRAWVNSLQIGRQYDINVGHIRVEDGKPRWTKRRAHLTPEPTPPTPETDFRSARWGMSKDEVKQTEEGKPALETRDIISYRGTIDGVSCVRSYLFDDNALSTASIKIENVEQQALLVSEFLKSFSNNMSSTFGAPVRTFAVGNTVGKSWQSRRTRVGLLMTVDTGLRTLDVDIIYQDLVRSPILHPDGSPFGAAAP